MTLHIKKLCVGVDQISQLEAHIQARKPELIAAGEPGYPVYTRNTPKRFDEIKEGGSLYWVINGIMNVRQSIIDYVPMQFDSGKTGIRFRVDFDLIRVEPRPHRPFQGWRYLVDDDKPLDLPYRNRGNHPENNDPSPEMLRDLARLGLI